MRSKPAVSAKYDRMFLGFSMPYVLVFPHELVRHLGLTGRASRALTLTHPLCPDQTPPLSRRTREVKK